MFYFNTTIQYELSTLDNGNQWILSNSLNPASEQVFTSLAGALRYLKSITSLNQSDEVLAETLIAQDEKESPYPEYFTRKEVMDLLGYSQSTSNFARDHKEIQSHMTKLQGRWYIKPTDLQKLISPTEPSK